MFVVPFPDDAVSDVASFPIKLTVIDKGGVEGADSSPAPSEVDEIPEHPRSNDILR
jgi:hypothetical protein